MKVPTSEAMAATRRLRNVGARMFVVQGIWRGRPRRTSSAPCLRRKLPALL